ncbi:Thiamine pyrophosphokinase [Komagataella phaffii CBS 7435]|uniref:Thiamine pyrophosphokinase n=2 Tax=Komagataella phaffii TaxID=460519 RepID=C4R3E5_KOMPG|nr:Thiamine pyrophosphokinase, phosphorylates thiamine to produce the coenzyme thiamine pyrophosphate ([Komagataella phaffii GS115] [Komagataella phaffii GS115]AOA63999.1 GQ67_03064T0 [Komagataella phaffii]CAH2450302.1 Thiamine pyrophosphokinase [Komagataella phaffii CBS 7435]AOA69199.1 GQ68_03048T0 [Komagataella phaffii GS115]CAY69980.1 Thiamine pyrophosphokinase, phosphorylates thiamine to produce the coenzyme thiamine pyrophosphate ([Komagataella phaffii GS115] [Komagataella phaffii GS115]C
MVFIKTTEPNFVAENADLVDIPVPTDPSINVIRPLHPIIRYQIDDNKVPGKTCLVILNQKINLFPRVFEKLWDNTYLRVCADGGANQLLSFVRENGLDEQKYLPKYIVGDMDSLTEETKNYYLSTGKVIVKTQSSQYATDFDKAITVCFLHFNYPNFFNDFDTLNLDDNNGLTTLKNSLDTKEFTVPLDMIFLGAIGGRFDQTIHSIGELYKHASDNLLQMRFFNTEYLEIIFLVPKGTNFIVLEKQHVDDPLCYLGLLPLNNPFIMHTKGLKYDVANYASSMTGNISSSNYNVGSNGFYVQNTDHLVVNIDLNHILGEV